MKLGFVGLGDLGAPMALRLVRSGHEVVVWNRTTAKMAPLVSAGAIAAVSPAEVIVQADLVGLCLTSHKAVTLVTEGEDGLFAGTGRSSVRKVIADFSTGDPNVARAIHAAGDARGIGWVDSPVSGGAPAAELGELIIFAGGAEADIAALRPMFDALAVRTTRMGGPGGGQMTKLCNNIIVGTNAMIIAEMIAMARRAGVDVAALPEALRGGWADSKPLQLFGPRMAAHAFEPRLGAIDVMAKDVGLAKEMALAAGARTPLLDEVRRLYDSVDGTQRHHPAPDADLGAIIGLFERLGGASGT